MEAGRNESVVKTGWNKAAGIVGAGILVAMVIFVVGLFSVLVFRVSTVNFVENYEYSYKFDRWAGKIEHLGRIGYIITRPFIDKVHTVDTRPMQVCISAIQRVLNCKLVQFNPDGLDLFIRWHGRGNYTNSGGAPDKPTVFNQILMAYAYEGSGNKYPFLTIIRELKSEEVEAAKQ